jgi:glycine betaine catabolism B
MHRINSLLNQLNQWTMYRLVLFGLIVLWAYTIILSLTGALSYDPVHILALGVILGVVCNTFNWLLARLFTAQTNIESASITGLILTLIIGPYFQIDSIVWPVLIGVLAMATKYILAVNRLHIFNPAAAGILIAAIAFQQGASWWIGSIYTLPLVITLGTLFTTRARRWPQVAAFLAAYGLILLLNQQLDPQALLYSPIWFFVFIMLTEPITSPSVKRQQYVFGAMTALLYGAIPLLAPRFPYALETALLLANAGYYILNPRQSTRLAFIERAQIASGAWKFRFKAEQRLSFEPGQYMELTSPHSKSDLKGVRRFVSVASSPQADEVVFAMRVPTSPSSFKQSLLNLQPNQLVLATGPLGDFVLPTRFDQPIALIAGGIGITPFLSMLDSIESANESRDVQLLYCNSSDEIPFKDHIEKMAARGIVSTQFVNSSLVGPIEGELIKRHIPDIATRLCYVSGPPAMVRTIKRELQHLGVKKIKTDYFDGYLG